MNASQIARKTNLLRGTVKYRLRKLGYDTGTNVRYEATIIKDILEFSYPPEAKRKTDYSLDADIFFYWKENNNNSVPEIAKALNLPEGKVHYILKRTIKSGFVTAESKLNYLTDNQL